MAFHLIFLNRSFKFDISFVFFFRKKKWETKRIRHNAAPKFLKFGIRSRQIVWRPEWGACYYIVHEWGKLAHLCKRAFSTPYTFAVLICESVTRRSYSWVRVEYGVWHVFQWSNFAPPITTVYRWIVFLQKPIKTQNILAHARTFTIHDYTFDISMSDNCNAEFYQWMIPSSNPRNISQCFGSDRKKSLLHFEVAQINSSLDYVFMHADWT